MELWLRRSAWSGSHGDPEYGPQALVAVLEFTATPCVIPMAWFCPVECFQSHSVPGVPLHFLLTCLLFLWGHCAYPVASSVLGWPGAGSAPCISSVPASDRAAEQVA